MFGINKTEWKVPKLRLPRSVRNGLISSVVLLALLVIAGVVYTYVMGPEDTSNLTAAQPVAAQPEPMIRPHQPSPKAPASASVTMITSPVVRGADVDMSVKTNPGASCVISVIYDKTPDNGAGLSKKVADEYGSVSWSWTVPPAAPVGTWPAKVTCAYHDKTAVVQGDLQVIK